VRHEFEILVPVFVRACVRGFFFRDSGFSFVHLFLLLSLHSCICSCLGPFIRAFVRVWVPSFVHLFVLGSLHSRICSYFRAFNHLFLYAFCR
jgi:hypothetical protein